MHRRYFPLILLYGFGLALALSLVFNGFLLYEQSYRRNFYDYESGNPAYRGEDVAWQQQLTDCRQANQQKDSLIHRLEQAAPSDQAVSVQPFHSK